MALGSTTTLASRRPLIGAAKRPKCRRATKPQLPPRDGLDGRTNAAKFFDALARDIQNDCGGFDALSTIERSLIEAFCGAAVVLNNLNTRWALGERMDLGEHAQCVNVLVKVATRLGLKRRAKDVSAPTLSQYLSQRQQLGAGSE